MQQNRISTEENKPTSSVFEKGMTAAEVIIRLKGIKAQINSFVFVAYKVAQDLDGRLNFTQLENKVIEKATRLANQHRIPFWVTALITYMDEPGTSDSLIREAILHDKRGEKELAIDRDDLNSEVLAASMSQLAPGFALAVCSRVTLNDGTTAHIPMIDFRCPPSDESLRKIKNALRHIGQDKGVFLESGKSYHYYGLDLINEKEWQAFLGKCLLLAPIIDTRYIAHRLIDSLCRLRISSTELKPQVPRVVDVIDG
jgi:hypothetical protein